ncbi:hypothetical protein [Paraurantiacibacter namhicola]|nr:hypothetical protein [Paraurantiacibacter namhicola]
MSVLSIGDTGPEQWRDANVTPLRDAAYASLFAQSRDSLLVVSDGAAARTVQLRAPLGCRALVEVTTESGLAARADGRVIQVSYGLVSGATEAELAVIVAHELAHQILEHRRRLDLAGVRKGFFGQFGGNLAANRMAEEEADRLSVHLLANAGFDPDIAPRFWRTGMGVSLGSGLFRNRAYRSPDDRAAFLDREIDRYLGNGAGPTYPGHLLIRRDGPIIY